MKMWYFITVYNYLIFNSAIFINCFIHVSVVDTSKHDGQPQPEASLPDESGENEQKVESVTVELTGLQSVVDDTKKFIKKYWKKSASVCIFCRTSFH